MVDDRVRKRREDFEQPGFRVQGSEAAFRKANGDHPPGQRIPSASSVGRGVRGGKRKRKGRVRRY